jgi:hypothetical protein
MPVSLFAADKNGDEDSIFSTKKKTEKYDGREQREQDRYHSDSDIPRNDKTAYRYGGYGGSRYGGGFGLYYGRPSYYNYSRPYYYNYSRPYYYNYSSPYYYNYPYRSYYYGSYYW